MQQQKVDENQSLVSIVTPSYNQGRFIEETILSVKNQDYPNVEHIIVDGGSTDNTLEVISKYDGTYNMRWVSEPDQGQADAVNKGFDMAEGEIIGWVNSDDGYLTKDAITLAVNAFRRDPGVYVVHGARVIIDENSNFRKFQCAHDFDYQKYLQKERAIRQETAFFRREVVQLYRLDESLKFTLDIDFFLRIGKVYNMKAVKGLIGFFRVYGSNKSRSERYFPLRAKEREYLFGQYGYGPRYKTSLNVGFVDQTVRKITKALSGYYNSYMGLPLSILMLMKKSPDGLTIPIHLWKKSLPKYILLSLRPSKEF